MDITVVTAKLSREYETRSELKAIIKTTNEDIKLAEKLLRRFNDKLDFNEVQIRLLETLIKRPDWVKIEVVKMPPFKCDCPDCNPQNKQEQTPTASEPTTTKATPAKKPAKRGKK